MRGLSLGCGRELVDPSDPELLEFLIFQETGGAQRVIEVLLDFADLNFTCNTHQAGAKIERRLLAVKTRQARYQLRRNQEHGVRESKRVPDQQAGILGIGRRHEVQTQPQAGKLVGHYRSLIHAIAASSAGSFPSSSAFRVTGASTSGVTPSPSRGFPPSEI